MMEDHNLEEVEVAGFKDVNEVSYSESNPQFLETYQLDDSKYNSIYTDRTPKQIRERYLNYLRPNISHDKWTEDEDLQLLELIKEHGHRWKTIERFMCKRSQNQLKNRFYGRLKRTMKDSSS